MDKQEFKEYCKNKSRYTDPIILEERVNGFRSFLEPDNEIIYEPLIGGENFSWLHPDVFSNWEDAYYCIRKNWKSSMLFINEKDYFGVIHIDEFKRFRRSDKQEDYSDIHPFIQKILNHREEYLWDQDYITERDWWNFNNIQTIKDIEKGKDFRETLN